MGTASAADRKLRVLHELSNQNGGRGGPGHPREQTRIEPAHHGGTVDAGQCRRLLRSMDIVPDPGDDRPFRDLVVVPRHAGRGGW